MSLPNTIAERVTRLLCTYAGAHVRIIHCEPVTEGWSAQFGASPWPWVTRCFIAGDTGAVPGSVIVKVRRPEGHARNEPEGRHNERAALEFLTAIGSAVGPRLLAADDEAGILVMEDLGTGPALEDLLVGSDASIAELGLVAFARTLGQMHAATAGHAAEYSQLRSTFGPVDPASYQISILGDNMERTWSELQRIAAERPYLPAPKDAGSDVDEMRRVLSEPGPYLAFSRCRWRTSNKSQFRSDRIVFDA